MEKRKKPIYTIISESGMAHINFEGFKSISSGGNINYYPETEEMIQIMKKTPVIDLSTATEGARAAWLSFFLRHVVEETDGPNDTFTFKSIPLKEFLQAAKHRGVPVFEKGAWKQVKEA